MRLIVAFFLSWSIAASAAGKSVVDYFLELPSVKFDFTADADGHPATVDELRKAIKVKDEKNGYLEVQSPAFVPTLVVALFKKKDGSPLLAVLREYDSRQVLQFFEPKNGNKEVTADVLPKPLTDAEVDAQLRRKSAAARAYKGNLFDYAGTVLQHKLPRKGTTIRAISGIDLEGLYGIEIYQLKFDGAKFTRVD